MTTGKALNGKPYAGNPHVRFDEGEVASAATPRRGSLLYNVKKLIAVAAVAASVALPSWAAAKEATLVCFGYSGKTEISNFQALVKLTGNNYGFSYDDYSLRDGSDLWFTDSSGNLIPHEIDTWNPNGESFIWVKIPTLTDFRTRIVMHWGEARTAEQISSDSVWPGFTGVWHMGKTVSGASVTPTELDSTGHGLDAVANGADASAVAAMTETGGIVGNARNNANNNGLQVPDFRSHITDETKFAVSGWWSGTGDRRFFSARGNPAAGSINNYWELYGGLKGVVVAFGNGTTFQDNNTSKPMKYSGNTSTGWTYITIVYNEKTATLYMGGKAVATFTALISNAAPTWGFKIGNIVNSHGWVGSYDEVRMFDGVPSADRVAADYATMSSPTTFLTLPDEIATATWTGGGNDNDFTNPQNWNCTDLQGAHVDNALPNEMTFVTIAGESLNVQMPSGFSQVYRSISIGDCKLAADCDWRGLSAFTIDGTVNLNGRKLYVSTLDGAGTVTDDVAAGELVTDGSFEDISGTIPAKGTNGNLGYYATFNDSGAPQLRQWTVNAKTNCGLVKPVGGETTSPWVSVDSAPDGENVVFFQNNRTFSQQISVPSAGRYIVSFWYTARWDCRSNYNTKDYSGARIAVEIGGQPVGEVLCRECVSATAEKPFKKFCVEADLVSGTQTLAVRAVLPSGASSTDPNTYNEMIDAVSIRPAGVGELHLDSDSAVVNSTVTLAGTLKFVKEGTGAFTAAKADQFYAGGTEIRQGAVKLALDGQSEGQRFPFGAENGSIVVSTNGAAKGVFDMDGTSGTAKDCTRYRFVLNGGVIQNTGRDIGASASQLKYVRLTADSEWRADRNFGLLDFYSGRSSDQQTTLDLNGHVLSMRFATGIYFLVRNATVLTGDGGAIEVTGDGFFSPRTGTSGVNAADLDLDVAYRLRLQDSLSVHDYTAKYAGTYGDGSSALNVGGTFKPTVDRFYGPTMQDGSTIDLTAWPTTAGWPVCSQYTLGPTNIAFSADARVVNVDLHGRGDLSALARTKVDGRYAGYVLRWEAGNEPPQDLSFVLQGEYDRAYRLVRKEDGLLLRLPPGFILVVK